jgi:glycosyltransferase involved in cell wall biosynthesis
MRAFLIVNLHHSSVVPACNTPECSLWPEREGAFATEMKILHLTWTLSVGGAEEMLIDIVNQQCRTEQVWIIVVNDLVDRQVRAQLDRRVQVFQLNRKPGSRGIKPFLHLNWLIHRIRPDIIHAHTWSLVKILPFCRHKIVLTVHTTKDADAFDTSITRYDAIFAISEAVADEVQKTMNRVRPKVVVNGVRPAEIQFNIRTTHSVFRIIQVGRLEHNCKGQDILLHALARVGDQVSDHKISLDFVGDGSSRHLLEDMVRDLGLGNSVKFRGIIPRPVLYDELCTYDLLVQASRFEGFGLAAVEAMIAGVPVLLSDLEGPSAVIEKGRFGFLFRPDDYAECAQAILHIREMKRNETDTLMRRALAAREHALSTFDVKRTASEYLRSYRDVLGVGDRTSGVGRSEPSEADETQVTPSATRS